MAATDEVDRDFEKADMTIQLESASDEAKHGVVTSLTTKEQKKLMWVVSGTRHAKTNVPRRRIDIRMLPILGLMYSISLIDRTNLGLALVAGMQKDLGLGISNRYTIVVMIFFVAYM